ncbi:hypothetical protein GJ744_001225 [Endocarpon pusillum]|uniref:FAD dependent oxidoreductase domain-containing protein n=1 Tax=Endocarpon pusillum TaxID=364733 RepID=A0A8H7ACX1_9EURO|nr:hypothetical protein GJ744_001225 [Endocarpon pusillum]
MSDATPPPPNQDQQPILIAGAGIFGLSTALSLLHRSKPDGPRYPSPSITRPDASLSHLLSTAPIQILDASATLPNPVGSSVDSSRIIRADYPSPLYSRLARQAQERWRDRTPEGWGGEGRYMESGLVVVADHERHVGDGEAESGRRYVQGALENVRAALGQGGGAEQQEEEEEEEEARESLVQELPDGASIRSITGYASAMGDSGYVNWGSGWADAEACVAFALEKIRREDSEGRVTIECGKRVERFLFSDPESEPELDLDPSINASGAQTPEPRPRPKPVCTGIQLSSGEIRKASLVILATGSWTPTLVDLRGRAIATGQVLAYMPLSEGEHAALSRKPVHINMSRGMFVMPPRARDGESRRELKIARHGFGYRNPRMVREPALLQRRKMGQRRAEGRGGEEGAMRGPENAEPGAGVGDGDGDEEKGRGGHEMLEISVPDTTIPIPPEGEEACRKMAREAFGYPDPASNPDSDVKMKELHELAALANRPFSRTRLCWYCDTPSGNFLITAHPHSRNLFLATGGSGHAFKFFPVIGDKIVDAIEGTLEPGLRELWRWRADAEAADDMFDTTGDGSRGGPRGMRLDVEVGRRR